MTSSTASFFTGGGKGITWPDNPPKTVSGTITAIHPEEPVKDPKTGQDTTRTQVRIELQTDEKDPTLDFDDGQRTLYVKSYMRGAIGDALRKVGEREPKIGGKLTVTFTHTEAPERPGLSPSKHFSAVYEAPTASTGSFFGGGISGTSTMSSTTNGGPAPQKPESISQAAWDQMDAATRAAVSKTMAPAEPPF